MSLLLQIFLANMASRFGAIAGAIGLYRVLSRFSEVLLCMACGFLLTLSLGHLIPEAFEADGIDTQVMGLTMLGTLLFFILMSRLLEKGHVHVDDLQGQRHSHAVLLGGNGQASCDCTGPQKKDISSILIGATLHNFVDGILVATSFIVDTTLGWGVALAIFLHEIPQQVGYMVIFTRSGFTNAKSYGLCMLLAIPAVAGGFVGFWAIEQVHELLPYALAVSGVSFLFIVLVGLLPEVNFAGRSRASWLKTVVAFLLGTAIGVLLIFLDGHDHVHEDEVLANRHGHTHSHWISNHHAGEAATQTRQLSVKEDPSEGGASPTKEGHPTDVHDHDHDHDHEHAHDHDAPTENGH